jgi:hypothetical protein
MAHTAVTHHNGWVVRATPSGIIAVFDRGDSLKLHAKPPEQRPAMSLSTA